MEDLLKKLKVKIDYENQLFDKIDANSYEISVATSRYAREVNEKARKYFGSDVDILPRNIAMKKLDSKTLRIGYPEKETKEEK